MIRGRLAFAALACALGAVTSAAERPNILVLVCDQLSAKAVGAYGNPDARTPNIDRLARRGVRFARAYVTYPLCMPSRASFYTGRLPHETGVLSNGARPDAVPPSMPTLGSLFADAGYETMHFGKRHDAGALRGFRLEPEGETAVEGTAAWPEANGGPRDRYTTTRIVEFLKQPHARPFLAVGSLINPHDICSWVGANQGPHADVPVAGELPPLPDNFEIRDFAERPVPVQYVCCSHRRLAQAAQWSETNYRHYLAAYFHYVARVDAEVGRILDALESGPSGRNTLVVLLADHGDGMASHRQVTKQVTFYEESARVPLLLAGAGVSRSGSSISETLVSTLDLLPTLCEVAGVRRPGDLRGLSLAPWLRGDRSTARRDYVASEWHTEFGELVTPGRMLRTERYKYTRYRERGGEELFDLEKDPGETRTLVHDPAYARVLAEQRVLFARYLEETGDPFLRLEVEVDPRWRAHAPGFANHRGISAVEARQRRSER